MFYGGVWGNPYSVLRVICIVQSFLRRKTLCRPGFPKAFSQNLQHSGFPRNVQLPMGGILRPLGTKL